MDGAQDDLDLLSLPHMVELAALTPPFRLPPPLNHTSIGTAATTPFFFPADDWLLPFHAAAGDDDSR